MKNITVISALRKDFKRNNGAMAIVIRIYESGKTLVTESTGIAVQENEWNDNKREVKSNHPMAKQLNVKIKRRVLELQELIGMAQLNGYVMNKLTLQRLMNGVDLSKDFIKYARDIVDQKFYKAEHYETRRTYNGEVNKLEKFRGKIYFSDFDDRWFREYEKHLHTELKNSHNTVVKSFKFLHNMLSCALKDKYIKTNPLENYERKLYQQNPRSHLHIEEIEAIEKKLPTLSGTIQGVGYYFMLMCRCGLRFNDAMKFNYDLHVVNGERIVMQTQKASTWVNLFINEDLCTIIEYIKEKPMKMSNKEFNKYLKVLADVCGIKKEITAHVGRHSFGAVLARNEIPIETAQALMGHRDKKSTAIYYHQHPNAFDNAMRKISSK